MAAKKKNKLALLKAKLAASDTLKHTAFVDQSTFFVDEFYDTAIPALNIALSARLDGGFSRGSTLIAGDSQTFKTMFMLTMAKSYMDSNPDAIFVFYDVEFGTNSDSFQSVGIDTSRVMHKPLTNVDQLTHDISVLLDDLDESDEVFIGIDSLGAIASKKEQDDALAGSDKADMTRAKKITSFWRIVNPYLNILKIPMVAVGQTYETQEFISKTVIKGGKGNEYFPNNTWLITKAQVKSKDKKTFLGSLFNVNVYKGRLTRAKSKFPIRVTFEEGIDKFSALMDIGLDLGFIKKGKISRSHSYYPVDNPSLECLLEQSSCIEFWGDLLKNQDFKDAIYNRYSLGSLEKVQSTGEVIEDGYDVNVDAETEDVSVEDFMATE
jgi:hypothetical protein